MTKNKNVPILLCSAVIAMVLCAWIVRSAKSETRRIEAQMLQGEAGWGYNILVDGKVVVHQPVMPAHGGTAGFKNQAQSSHAAGLVISRMRNGDFPRLTQAEVDSINRKYYE